MEEDMKIVENLINHIRAEEKLQYGISMYVQAIETLLKRYKELKEENEKLKKDILTFKDDSGDYYEMTIEEIMSLHDKCCKLEEENKKQKNIIEEFNKLFKSEGLIHVSELKNDLEHMRKVKAPGVKRLLMKKGIIGYLEKLLEERNI